ncbi:hypothetical protein H5410_046134 [Solanum commersonii]|uniref:Uncharacterized protein n=1 Tax=Solanum commersonii TaxID=4109 RepID=A0A9J5XEP5_SOLCO|nr:hypothetical protein H5410_046134 [Solanum commersonii]
MESKINIFKHLHHQRQAGWWKEAPSKTLTSHPFLTTEASDNEHGEEPIGVIPELEWIARVNTMRQFV